MKYHFEKSSNLRYTGCNLLFAELAGFPAPSNIIGKTDQDCIWGKNGGGICSTTDRYALKNGFYESTENLPTTQGWLKFNILKERTTKECLKGSMTVIQNSVESKMLATFSSGQGVYIDYISQYLKPKYLMTIAAIANCWPDDHTKEKLGKSRQAKCRFKKELIALFQVTHLPELKELLDQLKITNVACTLEKHNYLHNL
ncbi:hypothetical protein [Endozoicomonas sp. Mp262]|uniref:hypothetical protein n=1 Tax=Endozoicomonas sp. Mp262 TaxID=2919499 RepID=UPI0021D91A0B